MSIIREQGKIIRNFILENIGAEHLIKTVAEHFNISRQTVHYHIKGLINDGLLVHEGQGVKSKYKLKPLFTVKIPIDIDKTLEEDKVWREVVKPKLPELKDNVLEICHYGFTEMLNNVIDHSAAEKATIHIDYDASYLEISIIDYGIGIFNKIQKDFNLPDKKLAILELSKGKLTSDPKNHSGEGIFFTSRMFDNFYIFSDELSFSAGTRERDYLFEANIPWKGGTAITMRINFNSDLQIKDVFNKFTNKDDIGFTKTIIPVHLLQYEGETLISRSQAKRLIVRFEKFKEVVLDFEGIKNIGQAFADEVFRVFKNYHPEVNLGWMNTNTEIDKMIQHVMASK